MDYSQWILVKRPCGEVFANKSRQIWIVKYQEIEPTFFKVYIPKQQTNKKEPWLGGVDNVSITHQGKNKFSTFEEAVFASFH